MDINYIKKFSKLSLSKKTENLRQICVSKISTSFPFLDSLQLTGLPFSKVPVCLSVCLSVSVSSLFLSPSLYPCLSISLYSQSAIKSAQVIRVPRCHFSPSALISVAYKSAQMTALSTWHSFWQLLRVPSGMSVLSRCFSALKIQKTETTHFSQIQSLYITYRFNYRCS